MDAEETLAEGNENGDMEERVWGQLMQLDPVDENQATKEFMDRRSPRGCTCHEGCPTSPLIM
jgi:hypothetical protein